MISTSEPRVERVGGGGCFGGNIWVGKMRCGVGIISKTWGRDPEVWGRNPGQHPWDHPGHVPAMLVSRLHPPMSPFLL